MYIFSAREKHKIIDPLTDSMAEMAINRKHWKDIMFNENFLAETGDRGILEFKYGGCN